MIAFMKVVHLTFRDRDGGAAIATGRIHQALLRAGVDSKIFVLVKSSNNPLVNAFDYHCPRRLNFLNYQWYAGFA